jgi:hypothetical protein
MTVTVDASGTFTPVIATRSVADAVTNGTVLITSATAAFVAGDQFRIVTGTADLPTQAAWIAAVSSTTNINLQAACTASHSGQALTLTNEYVLDNVHAPGTYTCWIDPAAMAAGDVIVLRVRAAVLTGGVSRVLYAQSYRDVQAADNMIQVSVPVSTDLTDVAALLFTLAQTTGTARAFPWKVLRYA